MKEMTDYQSCDETHLEGWMKQLGYDMAQYIYPMLKAGVDKHIIRYVSDEQLKNDCGITNGIHRMKILEAAKRKSPPVC